MVVALEDVQELGENREVARGVLVLHRLGERVQGEQAVEVVSRAKVEGLTLAEGRDLPDPRLQRKHQRMRRSVGLRQLDDPLVHIAPELGHGTCHLASPVAVPAEEHGKAGDHEPDLFVLEVGAGPGAEGGDAARLKRCEVRAAVVIPHAVQEQSHLAVVCNDRAALEELDKLGEALGLVARVASPDADDRRVVWMPAVRIGLDGLVEAKRHAGRVGPVGRGHPAVVALDDGVVVQKASARSGRGLWAATACICRPWLG